MKFLMVALSLLSMSAQASYFSTHCSDSYGRVRWETGHNTNQLIIKIDETTSKRIDSHKVAIKFEKEMTIREENIRRCGFMSRTKVTVVKAFITPSDEFPNALDFLDGEQKIEAEFLCTNHMNSRAACPEKE